MGSLLSPCSVQGWPSHTCAPGVQGLSSSWLLIPRVMKEEGRGSLSPTTSGSESRIGGTGQLTARTHSLFQPSLLSPIAFWEPTSIFFSSRHGAEGVFPIQIWRGQDGTTSVGTTRSWLPSVSDQALAVKSTTEVPAYPSLGPLSQGWSSPPHPGSPSQTQQRLFSKSPQAAV